MYGATTVGVTIDGNMADVMAAVIENADVFVDADGMPIFEDVGSLSLDSMGLGSILY